MTDGPKKRPLPPLSLAVAGLAGEQDVSALVACLDDAVDDALARRGHPQLGVAEPLAEGRARKTEGGQPSRGAHDLPPLLVSSARSAPGGSKSTASRHILSANRDEQFCRRRPR